MNKRKIRFPESCATVDLAEFVSDNKITEYHAIIHIDSNGDCFEKQYNRIREARESFLKSEGLCNENIVFQRYFLSDAINQSPFLTEEKDDADISLIQQPPLDGSKIAIWLYLLKGPGLEINKHKDYVTASYGGHTHFWKMGMTHAQGSSYEQTKHVLERYESFLADNDMNIAENCVRTWFFVRDVDTQYQGMVEARKENFISQGMTESTHYISSTGIYGLPAERNAIIQMGTYAVKGLYKGQQKYLYAMTHLNPTYEYGVTFERGTAVDYDDRRQIYISGTASIDNKGDVLFEGDIRKQTERMIENVGKLLEEGQAGFDDIMQIIVYLRDVADCETVKQIFAARFADTPLIITYAPVCRPAWLIEMECMAVTRR